MTKKTNYQAIHKQRRLKWALTGSAAFALAYAIGSRALDTGSWLEYGATLALLIFVVNRLLLIVRRTS